MLTHVHTSQLISVFYDLKLTTNTQVTPVTLVIKALLMFEAPVYSFILFTRHPPVFLPVHKGFYPSTKGFTRPQRVLPVHMTGLCVELCHGDGYSSEPLVLVS